MKFDLSKLKRVTQTSPPDQFELDATRRENQLNDWVDPEPDNFDYAFMQNPKLDSNELYNEIHNYDYDNSDPLTSPFNDDIDGIPRYLYDIGWRRTKANNRNLRSRLAPRGASR